MNIPHKRFAVIAAAAVMIAGAGLPARAADVVIVANGGPPQDAHRQAMWQPASKALGMTFDEDTSQSWTEAKAQVDSGSVTWDIVNLNMGEVPQAVAAGILVKLPADIVDRTHYAPGSVNDYCMGNTVFSMVIAYNTAKFGNNGPKNMVDFFDVTKFPGKRALLRSPRSNVEAGALALGHSQSELYSYLQTDDGQKAVLDKLADLKPTVTWWDSGSQLTQLIKDGEVDLAYGLDGRINAAIDAGAPWKIVYQDGLLSVDCYAILKGSPHPENALKFLKEILKPQYTKDMVKYVAYGPADLTAYDGMDPKVLSRLTLAPKNLVGQYPQDVDFWGKSGAKLSEAFDAMLVK
ncbi:MULTISPECIES: ABC transporter substrate-binding protein [unclassified Mesorhizobium]|uniref:ABC transporter substrate-binding protein n=1 Tax=unclassified Mesorhizobium TaxID=325217 RepID=UPI00241795F5|nr:MULTISPECIES: ABC transporter substrate-binding protein [unclassified Mesorhizobium]WFP65615.1 ABC transporter substrate-binding protein [Mesorhizobium sp. WSM4904]WFP78879.1 ABC transporter substrate-binding protein [Mesorhizobium sp. WSM4906]